MIVLIFPTSTYCLLYRFVMSRDVHRHVVMLGVYIIYTLKFNKCIFFMHALPFMCKNFITIYHIDIIGMVAAISPLERTRNRGTVRQELVLCDRKYVFHELVFKTYFLMYFVCLILIYM